MQGCGKVFIFLSRARRTMLGAYAPWVLFHMDQPVTDRRLSDRHLWIEVAEYLVAVVGVIALAWLIADVLGSPLWGGLTSIRLR